MSDAAAAPDRRRSPRHLPLSKVAVNPAHPTPPDTAARSLSHWSEDGRTEMEAFYALAHLDYEILAGALDWTTLLGSARRGPDEPLT
ncbi:MAG: hypothetical protein AAGC46_21320, partial [Solirubrobacteraceae bacterium]